MIRVQTNEIPGLSTRHEGSVCSGLPWKTFLNSKTLPSDHHVCQLILDVGPSRRLFVRRKWDAFKAKQTAEALAERLAELPDVRSASVTEDELEAWAVEFHKAVYESYDLAVPVAESAQGVIHTTSADSLHAQEQISLLQREWERLPTDDTKIERENDWHNYISRVVDKTGSYARLYRQSMKKETAKETAHMPPLRKEERSKPITDPREQCDLLAETLLGALPTTSKESCYMDLPFEDDCTFSCDPLAKGELLSKWMEMPMIRATVDGGIPNRFLKDEAIRNVLIPYLELFCK